MVAIHRQSMPMLLHSLKCLFLKNGRRTKNVNSPTLQSQPWRTRLIKYDSTWSKFPIRAVPACISSLCLFSVWPLCSVSLSKQYSHSIVSKSLIALIIRVLCDGGKGVWACTHTIRVQVHLANILSRRQPATFLHKAICLIYIYSSYSFLFYC